MVHPPQICLAIAVCCTLGCGSTAPPVEVVQGTESAELAAELQGYVVWEEARGGMTAMALPAREQTVVLPGAKEGLEFYPEVHALSGPDAAGRIAYIEDHFLVPEGARQQHLLKSIRIDGTDDTEIFTRRGNAMWALTPAGGGEIGTHLALAPTGGNVALLGVLTGRQMRSQDALLHVGRLEIWNLDTKQPLSRTTRAMDAPMSWFPDGQRLAYVRLTPRREIPAGAPGLDRFGNVPYVQGWDELPVVYVWNLETGEDQLLHVGWVPIVAADGNSVLVGGRNTPTTYSWSRWDMQRQTSTPVTWPGDTLEAIGVAGENLVIYRAWPTAGKPIAYSESKTPLGNPRQMLTVKAAQIGTTRFQTIVPAIDPRFAVSFGQNR